MADERTVVIASGDAETRERWSHALAEKFFVNDVAERGMLEQVMAELKPVPAAGAEIKPVHQNHLDQRDLHRKRRR
jgi:hypothetical protein